MGKSRRNYKELWEQLKIAILFSGNRRFSSKDLYDLLTLMEVSQLSQDPVEEILEASRSTKE